MKHCIFIISFLTLVLSGCTLAARLEEHAPPPPAAGEKVPICHKGEKTLYVSPAAVKAHLKHGDYRGVCR